MIDHREIFAQQLTQEIKRQKISSGVLAHILGISESSIYFYREGKYAPGFDIMILLAKVLHVSLDWLCGLDEEAEKDA